MANAIYRKYKEALLSGDTDISLTSGTVKISIMNSNYVFNVDDEFYSDISAGVVDTETFTDITVINGVFKASDISFDAVPDDSECVSIVIWIDTSNPATSRLVCFMDVNVVGLPLVADGTPVDLTFNTSGIFQL